MRPDKKILFACSFFLATVLSAQDDAKKIYEGNELYFSGKIPQSASSYAKALELNPTSAKANFNLGAALYKNGMLVKERALQVPGKENMPPDSLANLIFNQAAQNFAAVANSVSDRDTLHRAWHNIGNCYLQQKDFPQAVTAYKKALKFDPKDEETRYNLAYALKNMPKDKKGGGGGQQNQQQKNQQKEQKQQESQMNKQQAEQLLKAMMDQEKKLQEKRKQQQKDPSRREVERDW